MKNMVTRVIGSEWKDSMERLRLLNPPVAQTLNEWQMASNGIIPAIK